MHLLRNSKAIAIPKELGGSLAPGEWLCHDANAFEFGLMAERGSVEIRNIALLRTSSITPDLLLFRSGRIGDLLMLTPAIAAYKSKYPKAAKIMLSCFERHRPIFDGTELVDEFLSYPLPTALATPIQMFRDLGNVVEMEGDDIPQKRYADILGVTLDSAKPIYKVSEAELEEAGKLFKGDRPILTVQPFASVPNRCYPLSLWAHALGKLESRGWDVVILGAPGTIAPLGDVGTRRIRDLSKDNLTFRQSAAVVALADAHVGVDSAMLHIAWAVGTPAVGLFGPVKWQQRFPEGALAYAFNGNKECAGCNWHVRGGMAFPPDMPCSKSGICEALKEIEPDRIVAKVDQLREQWKP